MQSRQEASKELKKRGYKKDDEPGIWISPEGSKLAWWVALRREDIKFDSKTWGAEMTLVKEKWKEKKRLAKERKKEALEIYSDERLTEFAEGEAELDSHLKLTQ